MRNLGGRRSLRWVSPACCCAQPPDLAFITELQRVSGSTWPQSFVAMTTCLLGSVMIFFSFFFFLQVGKTSQQGLNKSGPTLPRWLCSQGRPGSLSVQLGALWWGFSLGIHPGSLGAQQARPLAPQLCCSWAPVWGHLRPPFPQMTLQPTLNRHTVNSPSTKGSLLLPPREGMGVLVCSQRRAALNRVSSPLLQIRFFTEFDI